MKIASARKTVRKILQIFTSTTVSEKHRTDTCDTSECAEVLDSRRQANVLAKLKSWDSSDKSANAFLSLIDCMQDVLDAETALRSKRPNLVWITAERNVMHFAVNTVRALRKLPAVDIGRIARVERNACGHTDYVRKFALYCAELGLGLKD